MAACIQHNGCSASDSVSYVPKPLSGDGLVVDSDTKCSLIYEKGWNYILINTGLCNDLTGEWSIVDYENIKLVYIGGNALNKIEKVTVKNCSELSDFIVVSDSDFISLSSMTEMVMTGKFDIISSF